MKQFSSVDKYISSFPADIQAKLKTLRQTVKELAPEAQEKISYGIPYYSFNGRLVYFAAFKDHISLFPASRSVFETFKKDPGKYKTSKGTIQFPLTKPLPLPLIRKIVKFRLNENLDKK